MEAREMEIPENEVHIKPLSILCVCVRVCVCVFCVCVCVRAHVCVCNIMVGRQFFHGNIF